MSKDKGLLLPSSFTPTHCFNIAAMLRTDAERLKGMKVKSNSKEAERLAMWISALENAAMLYERIATLAE